MECSLKDIGHEELTKIVFTNQSGFVFYRYIQMYMFIRTTGVVAFS